MALQIRRGTDAERTAGGGVVFANGELVYVTDTDKLYIGDGATAGGMPMAGTAITSIGEYIVADTMNSTLDLQQNLDLNGKDIIGTGNINIAGTITATGNINLGDDAGADTVNLAAQITSSLTPNTDATYDLGSSTLKWNNIHAVRLDGDVEGSVFGDDSTLLVDAVNNIIPSAVVLGTEATNWNTAYGWGDHSTQNYIVDGTADAITATMVAEDVITSRELADGNSYNGTFGGNLTGDVFATDGTIVLQNGSDGTDATFTGAVVGVLDGVLGGNTPYAITGTTIVANTGFTGNLTGNVVGNATGDLTGSVFADDSTLLVDAVAGSIPGANITGELTNNLTGNATGDHTGTFTGNIFTTLIDSDDSSTIVVTPRMDFSSDIVVNNSVRLSQTGVPGSDTVVIDTAGTVNCLKLETQSISHTGGGGINFDDQVEFNEDATFGKVVTFIDKVSVQTLAGEAEGEFAVETFTGDPDDDASVANPANYNKHFEATNVKSTFNVPVKFPSFTQTEVNALANEIGMVVFNTTNSKLEVCTGAGTGGAQTYVALH